ncbi:MAG: hypothetical protein WA771_09350 [Chthoniobacterales bacterium]
MALTGEEEVAEVPEIAEPTFVFHQVPGCGSRELVELVYAKFAVVHDEPDAFGGAPVAGEAVMPLDTRWLSAAKLFLFRSHFRPGSVYIDKVYPEFFENDRFKVFLFVDEPLRLAAVTYLHVSRGPNAGEVGTFAEFLDARSNPMAFFLGATRANYRSLLERYFFVGVNQKKAASLGALLRAMTGVIEAAGDSPNVLRTAYQLRRESSEAVDAAREVEGLMGSVGWLARTRFLSRNLLDWQIYRAAVRRLSEEMG